MTDAPVPALDVSRQAQVPELPGRIIGDRGPSRLFIGHDLSVVDHPCGTGAVLNRGQRGPVEQVFRVPETDYKRRLNAAIPGQRRRDPQRAAHACTTPPTETTP